MSNTTIENMKAVSEALSTAEYYHLQVEVVLTAIKMAQISPLLSIDDIMQYALGEWVK